MKEVIFDKNETVEFALDLEQPTDVLFFNKDGSLLLKTRKMYILIPVFKFANKPHFSPFDFGGDNWLHVMQGDKENWVLFYNL